MSDATVWMRPQRDIDPVPDIRGQICRRGGLADKEERLP